MESKRFDRVLAFHSGQNIVERVNAEADKSEGADVKPKLSEEEVTDKMRSMAYAMHEPISDVDTTPIPVPESSEDHSRQRSSKRTKKLNLAESFAEGAKEANGCSDGCECAHSCEPAHEPMEQAVNDQHVNDELPPLMHWKEELDQARKLMEVRRCKSNLPGCGPECGFGAHSLRHCKANLNLARHDMDKSLDNAIAFSSRETNFFQSGINLLTAIPSNTTEVNAVNQKLVWAQIPCAVDSGACAHVTPANIFAILSGVSGLQPIYYAADGSPIQNLGECAINAVLEDGTEFNTKFDVAKITRPLLSVHQIVENGHQLIFGKTQSYLQLQGGKRIQLRKEGKLYMLDMWAQIPEELAKSSPFVRQVAHP